MSKNKCAAVLVCAGSGKRMGESCGDKLMLNLCGRPVVSYVIEAYAKSPSIDFIVLVTRESMMEEYDALLRRFGNDIPYAIVAGGKERMDSVINGVRRVPNHFTHVAIADGARPLIRCEEIEKTVKAAFKDGAAVLGAIVTDTIKKVRGNSILKTVPREDLVAMQTPQVFEREEYLICATASKKLSTNFTDDASIYEKFGKSVTFVEGRRDNLKITVPEDIAILRAIMEERK